MKDETGGNDDVTFDHCDDELNANSRKARTIRAAATTRERQTPVLVKKAEVLAESINAPAISIP